MPNLNKSNFSIGLPPFKRLIRNIHALFRIPIVLSWKFVNGAIYYLAVGNTYLINHNHGLGSQAGELMWEMYH